MKLGITVEPYKGIAPEKILFFVKAILLKHVEINERIIPYKEQFISALDKLTTTFHLPIKGIEGYDLGSKSNETLHKISKVIAFINEEKKNMHLVYTLSHPPEATDSDFKQLMEQLQQIDTPIVLENIPWQSDDDFCQFYFNAKDILRRQLAGHAIDAAHRYITDPKKWLDVPKELLKEIVYVHLQDCLPREDAHLPIGKGVMPYESFLLFLKKNSYRGIINQEIKPNKLNFEDIMLSCLNCIRPFSHMQHLKFKSRYAIVKPILRNRLKKISK